MIAMTTKTTPAKLHSATLHAATPIAIWTHCGNTTTSTMFSSSFGAAGRIRTHNQEFTKLLRFHCATAALGAAVLMRCPRLPTSAPLLIGGGAENRTRVHRSSCGGSTCLPQAKTMPDVWFIELTTARTLAIKRSIPMRSSSCLSGVSVMTGCSRQPAEEVWLFLVRWFLLRPALRHAPLTIPPMSKPVTPE